MPESNEKQGFRGGIMGAILVLAATGLLSTCWEVNAARAKEVYSTKALVYRGIVEELGRAEGSARELQWKVSDWEASQDTSGTLVPYYLRSAREIQDQIRRLPFPPDALGKKSTAFVAAQRSWAELEALQLCVQNRVSPTSGTDSANGGIKDALDPLVADGMLTRAQADSIVEGASVAAPCGVNFSASPIQQLKLSVAAAGWKQLDGPWLTRLFSRYI